MENKGRDVRGAIAFLKECTIIGNRNAEDFAKRHFNGQREKSLVFCLKRGADIAGGCVLVAEARLPESLNILSRSLFEDLVWTRWILQSDENAKLFGEISLNELTRIARRNLEAGHATVYSIQSGEDKSQEILQSPLLKGGKRPPRFEKMAKETGLGKVYAVLYGFLSMQAHGSGSGFGSTEEMEGELFSLLSASIGFIQCINLTVAEWIVRRAQVPQSRIRQILGM